MHGYGRLTPDFYRRLAKTGVSTCGVNTVMNRVMRASGGTRGLVWTSAACITVSLLVMFFVSVAGPSIVVPAMAHAPGGAPPWWISLRLSRPTGLFLSWGPAVLGASGY